MKYDFHSKSPRTFRSAKIFTLRKRRSFKQLGEVYLNVNSLRTYSKFEYGPYFTALDNFLKPLILNMKSLSKDLAVLVVGHSSGASLTTTFVNVIVLEFSKIDIHLRGVGLTIPFQVEITFKTCW